MYAPIFGTGSGVAPVVNLTWPFLNKSDVHAFVDGQEVTYTWTGASQITFSSTVASGVRYYVIRITQIATPDVSFTDGAVLTGSDLNTAIAQLLYREQEVGTSFSHLASDIRGSSQNTVAAGQTVYLGHAKAHTTEAEANLIIDRPGTLNSFMVTASAAPGASQSFTYTIRRNGVDTLMSGSMSGSGINTLNYGIHGFDVEQSDKITIKLVTSAGAAAAVHNFLLHIDP